MSVTITSRPLMVLRLSKHAFLNRLVAVGIGEIRPEGPVQVIEEIL